MGNLEAACAMFLAYYDIFWRTRPPDGEARMRKPAAMAVGLMGTLRSFEDLLEAVTGAVQAKAAQEKAGRPG